MASSVSVTPLKKLRTDPPAAPVEDSPRKSGLRLRPQTPSQTAAVRMSPRKTGQPPSTPSGGQTRAETPRKGSNVRQSKEDGARIKQKEGDGETELLPATKSCSKTQVK